MPVPTDRPPVDRSLLRDDVYRRLRDAITDGTFAPGEQLRDGELATWLGVSRTPVREALLRLAQGGLVVARPGRSTVVSSLDERSTRDARDVVAAMHELAVREAVAHFTAADLDAMRDAARRFGDALDAGDIDAALARRRRAARRPGDRRRQPGGGRGPRAVHARAAQDRAACGSRRPTAWRSPDRHEELIRLCAAGDVDGAAAVAFDTWHTLPTSAD